MNRIDYIDILKGLAILVVVAGHCCEFGLGVNNGLYNQLYYSFHMPLFIFISGLLAYYKNDSFPIFLKKKTTRLIIPFISFGLILSLCNGYSLESYMIDDTKKGYWYLFVLFELYLLTFWPNQISLKIKDSKLTIARQIISFIPSFIIIATIYVILKRIGHNEIIELLSLKMVCKLYPFFVWGILTMRNLSSFSFSKNYVIDILLIMAVITFTICYSYGYPISLTAYFLVPAIYVIFKESYKKWNEKIIRTLTSFGKYTLQIYMLHYFLIPGVQSWGAYLIDSNQRVYNGNMVIFFSISIIMAIIICYLCVGVAKVISHTRLLNYLLFGIKQK